VTGGASGIGLATARLLRDEGAEVAILDRHAEAVADEDLHPQQVDVVDEVAVNRAVDAAAESLGGPADLLVTSAGVYVVTALDDLTTEQWELAQQVNARGTFLAARAFRRRGAGSETDAAIVALSSIAATRAYAAEPYAAYAASKAGVTALVRQMALEWAPSIRVNAVSPGVIKTPMLRLDGDAAVLDGFLTAQVPLKRLGRTDEVAAAIAFLLSDAASYITGVDLPVDGGSLVL
jgi:NAD(P)-dependent dehydrogenase (short-subunit alcohol dehydrogenase family)